MSADTNNPPPEGLYQSITDYISNRVRLGKLEFIETFSRFSISILFGVLVSFLLLVLVLFLGIGLAEFISFKSGDTYSGFFWVSAGLILLVILLIIIKSTITKSFQNKTIRRFSTSFFNDESI